MTLLENHFRFRFPENVGNLKFRQSTL